MSLRYHRNPDENFVVHGSSPNLIRDPPRYIKNSLLTTTTANLSQSHYHPSDFLDNPGQNGNLRSMSHSLNQLSGDLQRSILKEEIDRIKTLAISPSYTQQELREALADALNSYEPPQDLLYRTQWYTKPIHLGTNVRIPMSSDDVLADRFFPLTLGKSKTAELLDDVKTHRKHKRSKSASSTQKGRSQEEIRAEARRLKNLFLLAAEAPHINSSEISFTSPYTDEISKLRMEKLRIEERQYLELKRQAELERIRGPKPKWYELKGPQFHYEAQKNNELLRNSAKWDDLLQYREKLVDASKRLKSALEEYQVPVY